MKKNMLPGVILPIVITTILCACASTSQETVQQSEDCTAHHLSTPTVPQRWPIAGVAVPINRQSHGPLEHTDYDIWQVARNHQYLADGQVWGSEEAFQPGTLPSRVLVYVNGEFVMMPSEYEGAVFDQADLRFRGRPTVGDMGLTSGLTINSASCEDPVSHSHRYISVWDRLQQQRQLLPG